MEDRSDLLEALQIAPRLLSALIDQIPEERLDIRRGDGFWTIGEHASHLAQAQTMLLDRIHRFIREDHPEFVPYIPGDDQTEQITPDRLPMDEALAEFAENRQRQVALLKEADDQTWQKAAIHPEYEQYTLYILSRHMLMHDYWHMYRMEELWLTRDAYLTRWE